MNLIKNTIKIVLPLNLMKSKKILQYSSDDINFKHYYNPNKINNLTIVIINYYYSFDQQLIVKFIIDD